MPTENAMSYQVSRSITGGGWHWELVRGGRIIARGVAATDVRARADALAAGLSVDQASSREASETV
jgi:hypothetical protein